MVKRTLFNSKEKAILHFLYKKFLPQSPNSIARETGLSYITVNKYLNKLLIMKLVVEAVVKNGTTEFKIVDKKELEKRKPKKTRGEIKRYTVNPQVYG